MRQASYLCLLLAGGRVSADGNSQFESLWNTVVAGFYYAFDAYGWVLPAVVLSVMLLCLIALLAWWLEDIPFDMDLFRAIGGIFRWTRERWRGPSAIGREEA